MRVGDLEEVAAAGLDLLPGAVAVRYFGDREVLACMPVQVLMAGDGEDAGDRGHVYVNAEINDQPAGPRERRTDLEVKLDEREKFLVHASRPAALAATAVAMWVYVVFNPHVFPTKGIGAVAMLVFFVGAPVTGCLATWSACMGGDINGTLGSSGVCGGICDKGCYCICLPDKPLMWVARMVSGRLWRRA